VHCFGLPTTTAVMQVLFQCADELIQNSRWITTRKLAAELSVSKGSENNSTNVVGYFNIYAYWVVCSLTGYHKTV